MTETIEGNKVIAEFMGLEQKEEKWREPFPTTVFEIRNKWYPLRQMDYDKSWDWLMPVVSKCYSLCNEDQHPDQEIDLSEALLSCDISEVFEAVVKFITWYNTQSK